MVTIVYYYKDQKERERQREREREREREANFRRPCKFLKMENLGAMSPSAQANTFTNARCLMGVFALPVLYILFSCPFALSLSSEISVRSH